MTCLESKTKGVGLKSLIGDDGGEVEEPSIGGSLLHPLHMNR